MPNSLTSESLKKLLAALSQDEAEAAHFYTNLRAALFRYFEIKGITDEAEAADETLDRVAEKITQGATIDDIKNFTFGVAKFVALESVRREKYHARAVDAFYLKDSASDEFGKTDAVEHLRECFKSLYPRERELLLKYFADMPAEKLFEYRQKLAETEKVELNALRNRVSRLRRRLEECLGKRK